jgi:hypothetical protein
MGIASLVIGIVAVLISLISGPLGWVGALLGVIGIILGALGMKNPETKGVATAGLVLSIIATVLGLVIFLACVACIGGAAETLRRF